jgi:hypothetical protein
MAWGCQVGIPILATMNTHTQTDPIELHAAIKPGIDAHAMWFYIDSPLDGAASQVVRKMTFDGLQRQLLRSLLGFVAKQQGLAREVFTCCELSRANERSGVSLADEFRSPNQMDFFNGSPRGTCQPEAFGYHLHRKLTAMGVTNYAVQPQHRDERGEAPEGCAGLDFFLLLA